eukprot:TRINITY_DN4849_c0_g1_i1.p1 TRINITY_DN4849_c0_g1~~TRINITY_DN4849_c0_g1_i1.p1  ORF type:complete len:873 (-),score=160.44 TRINITY_DN4849_c0_g1_i1:139-2400(-)
MASRQLIKTKSSKKNDILRTTSFRSSISVTNVTPPSPPPPPPSIKKQRAPTIERLTQQFTSDRDKIAIEIYTTEITYAEDITSVVEEMLKKNNPFNDIENRTIFMNIETIQMLIMQILELLDARFEKWSAEQLLGDVFLDMIPCMIVYKEYMNKYEKASACLEHALERSEVYSWCQEKRTTMGQALRSYLIMPVQRLPRYELLLADLKKKTAPDHPDYNNLTTAHQKVSQLSNSLDNSINKNIVASKFSQMYSSYSGYEDVFKEAPHRYFVKEYQIEYKAPTGEKFNQMLLFNDSFAFAASQGNIIGRVWRYEMCWVDAVPQRNPKKSKIFDNAFEIMTPEQTFFIKVLEPQNSGVSPVNSKEGFLKHYAELMDSWLDRLEPGSKSSDPKRTFKLKLASGNTYAGDWENGKINGQGTFTYANGNVLKGHWISGLLHGPGEFVSCQGTHYTGDFKNGVASGQGTLLVPTIGRYIGEWSNGAKTGKGELFYDNGDKYVGSWLDDLFEGHGTYWFAKDLGYYEGEWSQGKKHKKGTLSDYSGKYEGEFVQDRKNGQGTFKYLNGDIYEGEWKNDMKHGNGKMFWIGTKSQYTGVWANDRRNGQGILIEENGAKYKGAWQDDQRNGSGTQNYASGESYMGDWVADLRHGNGRMMYINNDMYDGEWYEGARHGKGQLTTYAGSNPVVYRGSWHNNKRIPDKGIILSGIQGKSLERELTLGGNLSSGVCLPSPDHHSWSSNTPTGAVPGLDLPPNNLLM